MKYLFIAVIVIVVIAILLKIAINKSVKAIREELFHNGFVAIDFETTGLDEEINDITKAAAVRFVDGKEVDYFVSYAKPYVQIPKDITKLTGISNDDVKDAPPPEEVIRNMVIFINDTPVVAHNAKFDLKFLHKYAPNYMPDTFDTLLLSREKNKQLKHHDLQSLGEHYGLSGKAHDPLDDCRSTGQIFMKLLDDPREPQFKANSLPRVSTNASSTNSYDTLREEAVKFVEYARNILPGIPITATENSKYLVLSLYGYDFLKIRIGARLTYALLPGEKSSYNTLNLDLTDPSNAEAGNVRAMLTTPSDLSGLENIMKKEIERIQLRVSLYDLQYHGYDLDKLPEMADERMAAKKRVRK